MKKALGGLIGLLVALLIIFGGYIAYDNIFAGGEFTKTLFPDMFSAEEPEDNNSEDETVIIPEHEHEYSEELSFDETHHFYTCSICNRIKSAEKHAFEWVIDAVESETADGLKHEECVCGIKRNVDTVVDDIFGSNNAENIEIENNLYVEFAGNVMYDGKQCVYTDGTGSGITDVSFGYVSEALDNTFSCSMRYTAVYKEYDGTYTLNNNGMALKDAAGNNLSLNGGTWISMNFATPGFIIYDNNRNLYKVMLRMYPNADTIKYSLDVATLNERYRLVGEDINALGEDFLQCGYVDFDLGVFNTYSNGYIYGFKLQTANKEVTYLSDNSGTIKNDDNWFKCTNVNSTSGETCTIEDVLGWISETGISNSQQNNVYVITNNSYYASLYTKETTGSLVYVEKGSEWFDTNFKRICWNLKKN